MILIDSHSHLELSDFDDDRNDVIKRAHQQDVKGIITVGTEIDDIKKAVLIANSFPNVFAIIGIHPHNAKDIDDKTYDIIKKLSKDKKVVAIGEIGLDFFRNLSPPDIQRKSFREQIGLARELNLPIVIHDRDAHAETLRILEEENASEIGGVFHCFSGDWKMAKKAMDMGFFISFAGNITYKKATNLRDVARKIPKERILVETDAPFLTPVPKKGRNEPAFVRITADMLAKIRGARLEDIAEITTENLFNIFNLKI